MKNLHSIIIAMDYRQRILTVLISLICTMTTCLAADRNEAAGRGEIKLISEAGHEGNGTCRVGSVRPAKFNLCKQIGK